MAETLTSLDELKDAVDADEMPAEAPISDTPPREPVRDALGRSYATGKRKDAVARVWIRPGSGKVTVNGKEMDVYFARPVLRMILRQPFHGRFPDPRQPRGGTQEIRQAQGAAELPVLQALTRDMARAGRSPDAGRATMG